MGLRAFRLAPRPGTEISPAGADRRQAA